MKNQFVGKISVGEVLSYVFLTIVLVFCILPLIFMLTAAFMDAKQIMSMPYTWIPSSEYFTTSTRTFFTNFQKAIVGNHGDNIFFRNLLNSLIVATVCAITTVFLASLCGFGLAKYKFKGQKAVFMAIMSTMMIPFEAIMIPMYIIATRLHLQNTYAGLIMPFIMNSFCIFQMKQYLEGFPDEMLDAGRIDGLNEWGLFWKMVFTNSTPAIATSAILSFRGQWDNLLWPLLLAQKQTMKTIPAYLVKFTEEKFADEGAMMAVAVVASIPIIILFISLSKYFFGGSIMYSSSKE